MAFGHDQTIHILNKVANNKKSKIYIQRNSRDFGAISARRPPRFREKYRHRLCRTPTIWSCCDQYLKKHWKPDGLKQIKISKTSKSTRDVITFFTKSYEINQKGPSANYPNIHISATSPHRPFGRPMTESEKYLQTYRETALVFKMMMTFSNPHGLWP